MTKAIPWTEEEVDQLKTLWEDGVPTPVIMDKFGKSRSAIVGKISRIGAKRPVKMKQGHNMKTNKVAKTKIREITAKVKHNGRKWKLVELGRKQCRWPFGDPKSKNFYFCGEETSGHKTYCDQHHKMSSRGVDYVPQAVRHIVEKKAI